MDRQIKGITAATFAAPYLAVFFMALRIVLLEGEGPPRLFQAAFLEDVFALGTIGLLYACVPTLILSLITAGLLNLLAMKSATSAVVAGSLVGLSFGTFFSAADVLRNWHLVVSFSLSGAICGWIYWTIALRTRSLEGTTAPPEPEARAP